jgi:hypothetical protein
MNEFNVRKWIRTSNDDLVDLSNTFEVTKWCYNYHAYHPELDTGSISDRFCIAFYQLGYIETLMSNYDKNEFGEAVASALIHFLACFEHCGIICDDAINYDKNVEDKAGTIYFRILRQAPLIMRQVYYKAKNRKSRFNKEQLEKLVIPFINDLCKLNYSIKPCNDLRLNLSNAMEKLISIELKGH